MNNPILWLLILAICVISAIVIERYIDNSTKFYVGQKVQLKRSITYNNQTYIKGCIGYIHTTSRNDYYQLKIDNIIISVHKKYLKYVS